MWTLVFHYCLKFFSIQTGHGLNFLMPIIWNQKKIMSRILVKLVNIKSVQEDLEKASKDTSYVHLYYKKYQLQKKNTFKTQCQPKLSWCEKNYLETTIRFCWDAQAFMCLVRGNHPPNQQRIIITHPNYPDDHYKILWVIQSKSEVIRELIIDW